jgi:hypothetical protein
MKKEKVLPVEIEEYINKNPLFKMMGIVNLDTLRLSVKTDLSNEELKSLITKRFANEIVSGMIEFKYKVK